MTVNHADAVTSMPLGQGDDLLFERTVAVLSRLVAVCAVTHAKSA